MREERRAALESQTGHPQQPQEPPAFGEGFDGTPRQQPAYDNGYDAAPTGYDSSATAYVEQPGAFDGAGGHPAYEDPQQTQQTPYQEQQRPAYDVQYFTQGGGLPQGESFSSNGGYPDPAYAERVQEERAPASPNGTESFRPYEEKSYQDDWPQQTGYQNGYPDQYAPEAESAQAADVSEQDSVGFDRPGPAPSAVHELTDAGLPRRGSFAANGSNGAARPVDQEKPAPTSESNGDNGWRSANDARWQQASQLRKPKAGGVTSSGLPRRVPKANLVEGAAETTPQGGPQISRAPEDVRGRLSNLRRGVQRGRNAGSETNGQGFGPDSTYNQER
jgi:hypothetical protein